jgi:hypothetical protein
MWNCEANAGQDIMSNGLTRFLGDTPGRTALKLLVASFVVGVVMAAFNWYPVDLLYIDRVISWSNLWENWLCRTWPFRWISRARCRRGNPGLYRHAVAQPAQIASGASGEF